MKGPFLSAPVLKSRRSFKWRALSGSQWGQPTGDREGQNWMTSFEDLAKSKPGKKDPETDPAGKKQNYSTLNSQSSSPLIHSTRLLCTSHRLDPMVKSRNIQDIDPVLMELNVRWADRYQSNSLIEKWWVLWEMSRSTSRTTRGKQNWFKQDSAFPLLSEQAFQIHSTQDVQWREQSAEGALQAGQDLVPFS